MGMGHHIFQIFGLDFLPNFVSIGVTVSISIKLKQSHKTLKWKWLVYIYISLWSIDSETFQPIAMKIGTQAFLKGEGL